MKITTRDADGAVRRVRIGPAGLDLSARERRILRNAKLPDVLRFLVQGGGVALFLAFLLAIASTATKIERLTSAAGVAAAIGATMLLVGGVWTVYRLVDRQESDVLVRAWTTMKRCAACGNPLVGRDPDPDGPTRCVECGARWRL